MYPVTLEKYELDMAATVGCRRHVEALSAGLPDRYGADKGGWNLHIEGAAGELAFAKLMNLYWDGSVNTFERGDVGKIQIRTRSRVDYELIVRPKDKDTDAFVLVVGTTPRLEVIGYAFGRDAKREEWKQTHGGRSAAWFVPQDQLRPVDELYKFALKGEE